MRRTQIYITEDQERLVDARARELGVSKAEVIRGLLDAALGRGDEADQRQRDLDASAGAMRGAPTWQEWLAAVRASEGADARLRQLAAEEPGEWDVE
jgi:hypothetical protein